MREALGVRHQLQEDAELGFFQDGRQLGDAVERGYGGRVVLPITDSLWVGCRARMYFR